MESFQIVLSLLIPFCITAALLLLDLPRRRRQRAIRKYFAKRGEINVHIKSSSAVSFQDKRFQKKLDKMLEGITNYKHHKRRNYYRVTSTQGKIVEVLVLQYNFPFGRLNIYLDREI